jgi:hypothetical protein
MSSGLTYISATRVNTYTTIDALKIDIIKTLARWFSNYYVYNEHAVESWVQMEGTDVYVLYGTFQFELQRVQETTFELTMYAVGRFRRQGSSCDYFERVFDGLEQQLKHPSPHFATMLEAFYSKSAEDCIDFGAPFQYTHSNSVSSVLPVPKETVVYDEEDLEENLFTTEDAAILREDDYYNGSDGGYFGESSPTDEILLTTVVAPLLALFVAGDDDDDEESVLSEAESLEDEDDSDDEDSDDEDERIMSMPLHCMTDTQIDRYIDLSGQAPRDEIDRWTMNFRGGAIPRYSYVNFADTTIEDQNVSNVTIRRARFAGCTLRNFVFEQVHFDECDFLSVVLENVIFNNCYFTECDLDSYMSLDNSCIVENIDYEEEMRQAFLEDNVTYRYC